MWGSNGQIKRVDIDVPGSPSGARPGPGSRLAIHPNRPNPFGGFTVFDIEVTDDAPVNVTVYDVRGRWCAGWCGTDVSTAERSSCAGMAAAIRARWRRRGSTSWS